MKRLFPDGLKHNECERGKMRHLPPLRFVPQRHAPKEEGDEDYNKTITVELDSKTTSKIVPHTFVSIEDFLMFQKHHSYVLSQQDAKPNWKKIEVLYLEAVKNRDAISANTIDATEKRTRKKHEDSSAVLLKRKDVIMTKAFTLYQQMCGPSLRAEWDHIVQEHCFTIGWTDAEGDPPSALEQGKEWTTLKE